MHRLMPATLLLGALALAGCTAAQPGTSRPGTDAPIRASSTGTNTPTEPPALLLPTPAAAPATIGTLESPAGDAPDAQPAQVAWADVAIVDGDYFVRGNPAASIRLVDFSDFL